MKPQYFLLLTFLLALTACNKEIVLPIEENALDEFFDRNGVKEQVYYIEASEEAVITTSKGMEFRFLPHSFVNRDGTPVAGVIEIKIKEIDRKSEMILSNKTTSSGELPLLSGGQYYIEARLGNNELNLLPTRPYEVLMPVNAAENSMNIYTGTADAEGNINWQLLDTNAIIANISVSEPNYYQFYCNQLHWVNVDQLYNINPARNLTVSCHAPVAVNNVAAFVTFPDLSAIRLTWNESSHQFTFGHLPEGVPVTLILIGVNGNNLYLHMSQVISNGSDVTVTATISPVSEENLKAQLRTLD